jgi:hypothetical protein
MPFRQVGVRSGGSSVVGRAGNPPPGIAQVAKRAVEKTGFVVLGHHGTTLHPANSRIGS